MLSLGFLQKAGILSGFSKFRNPLEFPHGANRRRPFFHQQQPARAGRAGGGGLLDRLETTTDAWKLRRYLWKDPLRIIVS